MCVGVAVPPTAERNDHASAHAAHNQRHGAVGSNPFLQAGFFSLKLKLSMQISPHDWFLVLIHPAMMTFSAVQQQPLLIEAFSALPCGGGQPECPVLRCIQTEAHSVVRDYLLQGSARALEDLFEVGLCDCCSVDF